MRARNCLISFHSVLIVYFSSCSNLGSLQWVTFDQPFSLFYSLPNLFLLTNPSPRGAARAGMRGEGGWDAGWLGWETKMGGAWEYALECGVFLWFFCVAARRCACTVIVMPLRLHKPIFG